MAPERKSGEEGKKNAKKNIKKCSLNRKSR